MQRLQRKRRQLVARCGIGKQFCDLRRQLVGDRARQAGGRDHALPGDKLGVSFQQVQKYEKGVNRVGAARLQSIATALDVPVTFFYDGDGKAREVESLLFLDSAFSLRLLRAYSKIKDQTVQRQLVSLMESIAANED